MRDLFRNGAIIEISGRPYQVSRYRKGISQCGLIDGNGEEHYPVNTNWARSFLVTRRKNARKKMGTS